MPTSSYDLPIYATPKVHRDHHVEVAKALYSVPGNLIGQLVDARADRALVRISHRGQLVKVHPRMPAGGRSTDPDDLPSERTAYALRDLEALERMATRHGAAIGAYAAAVLEHPLPWTKMRQVYALLGLVKRWGPERVEAACARALEAEAISVGLIGRMIERATEAEPAPAPPATATAARWNPRELASPPPYDSLGERLHRRSTWTRFAYLSSPGCWWPLARRAPLSGKLGRRAFLHLIELKKAFLGNWRDHLLIQKAIAGALRVLERRGIDSILIKGWAVSRLYPAPGLRPPGDIDLCVHPRAFDAAAAELRAAGYMAMVDLHHGIGHPRSVLLDRPFEEVLGGCSTVTLGDIDVRVPSREQHLRLLCRHLLKHGLCRPIWLCDVALLVEEAPDLDWDEVLRGDRPGWRWVEAVVALARDVLGAEAPAWPRSKMRAPPWMTRCLLKEWGTTRRRTNRTVVSDMASCRRPIDVLRRHWPDPAAASFRIHAPLLGPRSPLQAAYMLWNTRCLPGQLRDWWTTDHRLPAGTSTAQIGHPAQAPSDVTAAVPGGAAHAGRPL